MAEYISREDALKIADEFYDHPIGKGIAKSIFCLPAADVVERKKGKWELEPEYGWYICSACRDEVTVKSGRTNFCPNCGADMRGEDDV